MADIAFWILLACALVFGLVLGRLTTAMGRAVEERRARKLQHQVRSLEAGLRVAQKAAEEAAARAASQLSSAEQALGEREDLLKRLSRLETEAQELRTQLRHECAKTARLRQELSDSAEAHARTSVELRDVRNELDVASYGSDVAGAELARLRAERDTLEEELNRLRAEPAGGAMLPERR